MHKRRRSYFRSQAEVDSFFSEFCKLECGNVILQSYECCGCDIDDDEQSVIDYFMKPTKKERNVMSTVPVQ